MKVSAAPGNAIPCGPVSSDSASPGNQPRSVEAVVVDDDSLVLEYFQRIFGKSNVPVRTFIDGEEALAELLIKPTSLLFVDSRMPLIDGIEVLEQLHAAGALRNTCAYLCSAAAPPADVYARAEAVGVAVLLKETQTDKTFLAMLLRNAERECRRRAGDADPSSAA